MTAGNILNMAVAILGTIFLTLVAYGLIWALAMVARSIG
jgi:hypothetical protein